jgi:hypothetical protein
MARPRAAARRQSCRYFRRAQRKVGDDSAANHARLARGSGLDRTGKEALMLSLHARRRMMKLPIAVFSLFLLFTAASSFAGGWVLMHGSRGHFGGPQVRPTKNLTVLEYFATAADCNNQRSSSVREIDERWRKIRAIGDRSAPVEAERELALLFYYIYINSNGSHLLNPN